MKFFSANFNLGTSLQFQRLPKIDAVKIQNVNKTQIKNYFEAVNGMWFKGLKVQKIRIFHSVLLGLPLIQIVNNSRQSASMLDAEYNEIIMKLRRFSAKCDGSGSNSGLPRDRPTLFHSASKSSY